VLRARAVQQVPRGAPGADLEKFETEYIIERERRERRLLAQHSRT
jgi:hypothetical protein